MKNPNLVSSVIRIMHATLSAEMFKDIVVQEYEKEGTTTT